MKLYQYAVILRPKSPEKGNGENPEKAKIIVPLKEVLAASDQAAMLIAAREIPEDYSSRLDEVEVVIRPF